MWLSFSISNHFLTLIYWHINSFTSLPFFRHRSVHTTVWVVTTRRRLCPTFSFICHKNRSPVGCVIFIAQILTCMTHILLWHINDVTCCAILLAFPHIHIIWVHVGFLIYFPVIFVQAFKSLAVFHYTSEHFMLKQRYDLFLIGQY